MERELTVFERSIGKAILATKSSFSFASAGRKARQNDMERRGIHSKSSERWPDEDETSSIDGEEFSNPTHGDRSAKTRKISNLLSDDPAMEEVDSYSGCSSVSDDHHDDDDESRGPHIEYEEETDPIVDTSGSFRWFNRFVREGDLCIDYICQIVDCDPIDMYTQTKTHVANMTCPEAVGELEFSESDVPGKATEEELPEDEGPKQKRKMPWFSLTKKSTSQMIELKNADPALDDLTDSDSWASDSEGNDSHHSDEKLLSSSPDLYFESIQKSSNREGDANEEEEVRRILCDGRVMCEV